jgi:uncharacterized protein YciI
MLYALICTDKPGSIAVRKANRPDHVAFLQSLGDDLVFAGPFTGEDGETPNGSLVVIQAPSRQAAQEIATSDPYAKAGLFASVEIRPWIWVFNPPKAASA